MPKSLAPKRAFARTPKISIVSKKKNRDQPMPVDSTPPETPEDRVATVAESLVMIKNMTNCIEQDRTEMRAQLEALKIANTEWQTGQQLALQAHINAVAMQLEQQNVQMRHMTTLVLQLEGREHPSKYKHSLEFAHGAGMTFQHPTPQSCAFVHIDPVNDTFTFKGAQVATVTYVDAKTNKQSE